MAIYNPSIPNASDLISVSQSDIKDNFTVADTGFDQDHVKFSAVANIGKHDKVTFIQGSSGKTTTPSGTDSILFTSSVAGVPTLGFKYPATIGTVTTRVPLSIHTTVVTGAVSTANLFDFTDYPAMYGTVALFDSGSPDRTLFSQFVFTGGSLYTPSVGAQLASGGKFTNFQASGKILQMVKSDSISYTVRFQIQAITF